MQRASPLPHRRQTFPDVRVRPLLRTYLQTSTAALQQSSMQVNANRESSRPWCAFAMAESKYYDQALLHEPKSKQLLAFLFSQSMPTICQLQHHQELVTGIMLRIRRLLWFRVKP